MRAAVTIRWLKTKINIGRCQPGMTMSQPFLAAARGPGTLSRPADPIFSARNVFFCFYQYIPFAGPHRPPITGLSTGATPRSSGGFDRLDCPPPPLLWRVVRSGPLAPLRRRPLGGMANQSTFASWLFCSLVYNLHGPSMVQPRYGLDAAYIAFVAD